MNYIFLSKYLINMGVFKGKMQEFQCESCGAIYTLDSGNIPPAMFCTCRNKSFKIARKANILLEAN